MSGLMSGNKDAEIQHTGLMPLLRRQFDDFSRDLERLSFRLFVDAQS